MAKRKKTTNDTLSARREKARAQARSRIEQKRANQKHFVCDGWENARVYLTSWKQVCNKLITGLVCCAYCASVAFGGTTVADHYRLEAARA